MPLTLKDCLASGDAKGHLQFVLDKLPENTDISEALNIWAELKDALDFYKDMEMKFRVAIDRKCFPAPKQGTNVLPLANGYKLKATHKTNLKVDEELFPLVREQLASQNLSLDSFLKVKYELALPAYSAVVKQEAALPNKPIGAVLRQMITATPAAPALVIEVPKD